MVPQSLSYHFTFIILLTAVVTWLSRRTEHCIRSSSLSLCPVLSLHFHFPNYHCCNPAVQEDGALNVVFQCLSLCSVPSLQTDHPIIIYHCCNLVVQEDGAMHVGYNPSHHCCILAVQEDGAFIARGLPVSVLTPCSMTLLSSSYLPLL